MNFILSPSDITDDYLILKPQTQNIANKVEGFSNAQSRSISQRPADNLVILDWDDTLLPTHWIQGELYKNNQENEPAYQNIRQKHPQLFENLQNAVQNLIATLAKNAQIIIVSNAGIPWLTRASNIFYPGIECFKKHYNVQTISARVYKNNEQRYPNNPNLWKVELFEKIALDWKRKCTQTNQRNAPTNQLPKYNVISIGDGESERGALKNLPSAPEWNLKSIKFVDKPAPHQVYTQILHLTKKFPQILSVDNDMDNILRNKKEPPTSACH